MTDLRVPERYLNDRRVMKLTPIDFTSFVMASLWSVSNRTDGQVEPDDLPLIPMFNDASIRILVEKGLWVDTSDGWEISDYATTQTSKHDLEVLENARRADRQKKARQRAEARATKTSTGPTFSPDPRDSPGDMSPGGHRTGQAGKDEGKWHVNIAAGEVDEEDPNPVAAGSLTWDVAPIPGSKACRVCLSSLSADFPLDVCPKQDESHTAARRSVA